LIHRGLTHRRDHPEPYLSNRYEPLPLDGRRADDAIGFCRPGLSVVVPRLGHGEWGDTTVELPRGRWTDIVSGTSIDGGRQPLAKLFAAFPVAILGADG
jgi:(1->4)-alpha-D-glucan 1-alpha-D-glucosylmutase